MVYYLNRVIKYIYLADFLLQRSPQPSLVQDKLTTQLGITMELLEGFLYGKKQTRLVDVQAKETRKRKWDGVEDESHSRKLQSLCKF